MSADQLTNLLQDFFPDLRDPGLLWQIGTIVICLLGGALLARLLSMGLGRKDIQTRFQRWGGGQLTSVLSPLLAFFLLLIAKVLLAHWQPVQLLRMALPLCASYALIRLVFAILDRLFVRSRKTGTILLLAEKVFATLVWCAVALYVTGLWSEFLQSLEDIVLPVGNHKITLMTILQAAISVSLTLLLALWGGALLEERLMQLDTVHSSLRVVLARTGRAVLILIAVLLSLSLVGIDLTVLSVFGGALGVGIGLGLQKLVGSYVSGFVILIERSLSIGDMVGVDKYYGKVTQINTRYTILQGLDGIESVVPNEMLISSVLQNYSLTNRVLRLVSDLVVTYDTDVEALLPLLEQTIGSVDRVIADPLPSAMLLRFGPYGLEIELSFWIADPENGRANVISDVNRAVWLRLQAQGVHIAMPGRDFKI